MKSSGVAIPLPTNGDLKPIGVCDRCRGPIYSEFQNGEWLQHDLVDMHASVERCFLAQAYRIEVLEQMVGAIIQAARKPHLEVARG